MTIKMKLFVVFGSILVLFSVMSFYNIVTAKKIKAVTLHVKSESAVFASLAREMQLDVVQVQQWLSDISATRAQDGLNDGFDEAEKSKKHFLENLNRFQEMFTRENDTTNLTALAAIKQAMNAYHDQGVIMAKAYIEGGPASGNKIMADFDAAAEGINELIEPFLEEQLQEHTDGMESITTMVGDMTTTLLFGSIFMLAIIVGSTLYIILSVTRPINNVTEMLKDISEGEGDLTIRLQDKGNDELAELSKYFNLFVSKLQVMFKEVVTSVESLSSTSSELSSISNQMSANSQQTTSKVNAVASAAEEMSANMNSVASASEETSVNVDMVAAATEEMSATITEIATNTEKTKSISGTAVLQSQNASEQINELGVAAQEVGKVTEAITEISEQTNLLALNATIEAARAGEAGKGFAVVANEIKDLAKQTSDATSEIKDKISKIQSATTNSVKDITQITAVINEVNEMVSNISITVEEQASATEEIAANVSQASQGIQEVNENVAQASSVTGEVASDITEVGQGAEEITASSIQVNENATELNSLAATLTKLVGQFKV